MRMLLVMFALAAGSYLVGRQVFDDSARAIAPSRMAPVPSVHRTRAADVPPAPAQRVPRRQSVREQSPVVVTDDGSVDDDILLDMMTHHGEAMEMLREAIYFTAVERFGSCPDRVRRRTVCWINYYVELNGQFAQTRLDTVDCGLANDVLAACLRLRLSVPFEPLGIPQGAADELGAYAGPVQVPLTWYPGEGGSDAAAGSAQAQ